METHEKTECEQEIKCEKCKKTMTRGFYWSKHYSKDNENIECLKAQIKNIETDSTKYKRQIEEITFKFKNDIKKLEEEKKYYKNENNTLKKKLEEQKKSFEDIYQKLVLNNKEKE